MLKYHVYIFALHVAKDSRYYPSNIIMEPKPWFSCEVICYRCFGGKPIFISSEEVLYFSSGFLFPYLLSSVSVCCVWQTC